MVKKAASFNLKMGLSPISRISQLDQIPVLKLKNLKLVNDQILIPNFAQHKNSMTTDEATPMNIQQLTINSSATLSVQASPKTVISKNQDLRTIMVSEPSPKVDSTKNFNEDFSSAVQTNKHNE